MSDDRPLGFCPECGAVLWLDDDDGTVSFEPHDCEDQDEDEEADDA